MLCFLEVFIQATHYKKWTRLLGHVVCTATIIAIFDVCGTIVIIVLLR